jgi:predicted Zn-dependent protease
MKKIMNMKLKLISFCIVVSFTFHSCGIFGGGERGSKWNIFPIDKDIELGAQVDQQIHSDAATYPLLDEKQYPKAYEHLHRITTNILNSGQVYYRDKFKWKTYIIRDDKTLNAFCTPGGYIYVYSGIIKYLDNETQLAGVLGHEIAHADNRHSTQQLTTQYGIELLLAVVANQQTAQLGEIAASLALLKYSRAHEAEADEFSVKYLYPTAYDPRGAKYFFDKLIAAKQTGSTPVFLSDHPDPKNRVDDITKTWQKMGGRTNGQNFDAQYQDFKRSLP